MILTLTRNPPSYFLKRDGVFMNQGICNPPITNEPELKGKASFIDCFCFFRATLFMANMASRRINVFLTFGDEKAPDASRTRGSEIY